MISEGSCDTETWSKEVENSALSQEYILHFKMYLNRKKITIFKKNKLIK